MDKKQKLCLKCMECCKRVYIPIIGWSGPLLQLLQARGIECRVHQGLTYAIIEQQCRHLTKNGCAIYELRPVACRSYDGREDPFYPEKCAWRNLK